MMTTKPSGKQMQMLRAIHRLKQDNANPPSIRDLQLGLNLSAPSQVFYFLEKLSSKGLISRSKSLSRAIIITPKGRKLLPPTSQRERTLPLLERAHSGQAYLASRPLIVPASLLKKSQKAFAIRLHANDLIIPQSNLRPADIPIVSKDSQRQYELRVKAMRSLSVSEAGPNANAPNVNLGYVLSMIRDTRDFALKR